MKLATILTLLLSNNGYWFGDRQATVSLDLSPAAPAGEVTWVLSHGDTALADGKVAIQPGRKSIVKITPAAVRTRSELRLAYRATSADGKLIDKGELPIHLFPPISFSASAAAIADQRLVVWETGSALSDLLTRNEVPHVAVKEATELRLSRPRGLIIGPDAMGETLLEMPPLLALARGGASVLILRQSRVKLIAGYALATRTSPAEWKWRLQHPLLVSFFKEDLETWADSEPDRPLLRTREDEPVLELGWIPAEVQSNRPAPLDMILATKTVGDGRIVFCQLPTPAGWTDDPRWQLFLRSAVEYLSTPAGPTPRPSERTREAAPERLPSRDILAPR